MTCAQSPLPQPSQIREPRPVALASLLVNRPQGARAAALALGSVLYGAFIIEGLPLWDRMAAASGGTDLQARWGYGPAEGVAALAGLRQGARAEALAFYALDAPNAVLYALGLAAMMAFGLRRLGLA